MRGVSPVNAVHEVSAIRARLKSIVELIVQYQATLGLLERERLVLQAKLRVTGRNPSSNPRGGRT